MKIVSQLDSEGYFLCPTAADESPLEEGVYLLPGGAVDVPPPDVPEGQRARRVDDTWVFEAIPSAPEPESKPAAEHDRRSEILVELEQIDFSSQRPARAVAIALGQGLTLSLDNTDLAKLTGLEAQAAELRAELAALTTE